MKTSKEKGKKKQVVLGLNLVCSNNYHYTLKGENMTLAEKLNSKKVGLTIDDIKALMEEMLKPINADIKKLLLIASTIDNKLSTKQASISPATKEALSTSEQGFHVSVEASKLISDIPIFKKIADKVYHLHINFEVFKTNFYSTAKEMGIDVRKVIPSLKSKEIWKHIESQWGKPTKKSLDVTNRVTLLETLKDSGINMDKVKEVIEYFSDLVEIDMFQNGILKHDEWKSINQELEIDYSNKLANLESKVRQYVSTMLLKGIS